MTGNEIEVGTRGMMGHDEGTHFTWDASLYYMQLKNEILSTANPVNNNETNIAFNADKTVHSGLESLFALDWQLVQGHFFSPKVILTYNHFKFKNSDVYGNNTIANAPRFIVKTDWLYRQHNGFYIGPSLDWLGSRYVDYANSQKVSGYHLFGFKVGLSRESFDIYLEGKNLNNKHYVSTISIYDQLPANARYINSDSPRAFYAGFSIRY